MGLAPAQRMRYGWPVGPEEPPRQIDVVYSAGPAISVFATKPAALLIDTHARARTSAGFTMLPTRLFLEGLLGALPSMLPMPITKPAEAFILTRLQLAEEREAMLIATLSRERLLHQNAEEEIMLLGFSSEVSRTKLQTPQITVVERPAVLLSEARCHQCVERGRPRGKLLGHNLNVGGMAYCEACRQLVEVR